jgi:putative oxidoreductase
MKIASMIARYLLGFILTVFSLNGFFHFIPQPPVPEPFAVQYMTVMAASHYLVPVFLLQLIGGLLLLSNRFVPLALALLAPVIVNILLFHSLMNPEGVGAGALVAILWIIVFVRVRGAFASLFQARPVAESA